MKRTSLYCLLSLLAICLAGISSPYLQGQAGDAKRAITPRLDKTLIQQKFRELKMWPPNIRIVVGNPVPSQIPGLAQVAITASADGGIVLNDQIFVSQDGRYILDSNPIDLHHDLFYQKKRQLSLRDQPSFGKPDAPVTLVLFSDFECPFCKTEAQWIRQRLPSSYADRVKVVFADYPLTGVHPWSEEAALMGRCVYKQSNETFWEYYDWIYGHQDALKTETFKNQLAPFTAQYHLNAEQLASCEKSAVTKGDVANTTGLAHRLAVQSLPTIFVNGRKLDNPSWEELKRVIDYDIATATIDPSCGCSLSEVSSAAAR